jgi:hypothetical protein
MDRVVIAIAVLFLMAIAGLIAIGLRRWSRTGYRFRLKTLMILIAAASLVSYTTVEFILPRMQRQWAVQVVRQSRGTFYRAEGEGGSVETIKSNDFWSKKDSVEFNTDSEAISSANVLEYLPELTPIEFFGKVTDKGIKRVLASQQNTGMVHLSFQCPFMTDAALENIGEWQSLESILFMSSSITDQGIERLNDLKGLTSLFLYEDFYNHTPNAVNRNRFGPSGFKALAQQEGLVNLRFKGLVVSDECASHLQNAGGLKKLEFVYCVISSEALTNLRAALPNCEVVASHCAEPDARKPDWFEATDVWKPRPAAKPKGSR